MSTEDTVMRLEDAPDGATLTIRIEATGKVTRPPGNVGLFDNGMALVNLRDLADLGAIVTNVVLPKPAEPAAFGSRILARRRNNFSRDLMPLQVWLAIGGGLWTNGERVQIAYSGLTDVEILHIPREK